MGEPSPRGLPFDSQATALKPRSRIDTSERKAIKKEKKKSSKKGDEGFTEVQHARKPSKDGKSPTGSKEESVGGADASTANPYGDLDFGEDDHKKSEKDNLVFSKKKISSKPNSRRNSKKEKKSSIDEFEGLQPQRGAVIPLPVFIPAGGNGSIHVHKWSHAIVGQNREQSVHWWVGGERMGFNCYVSQTNDDT